MSGSVILDKFIPRTRRAFAWGVALALGVLGATILAGLFFVRDMARGQIVQRDAAALYATTLMEQLDEAVAPELEIRTDAQIGFDAAVRSSRLRGVLGIRFFDAEGKFNDTFPATIMPQELEAETLESMRRFEPRGTFLREVPLTDVFIYLPEFSEGRVGRVPILLATIPLHQRDEKKLAGVARFIIEGSDIAEEFARLDRGLGGMALAMFAVSGALMVAMLWPVFRRVGRLQQELASHGERLSRANDELALAARVSAVGAVSAHLMHGLRNPLASLSEFVTSHDGEELNPEREDWEDALTAARRMRTLVERVTEVLSEANGEATYQLTVRELIDDITRQVAEMADARRTRLDFSSEGNCELSSDAANLAGLVLVNLLENAIEATPADGKVSLRVSRGEDALIFRVMDEGAGFPAERVDSLFLPGNSTREGGSGLGLAISKRVAEYLGAELELASTSEKGCVFELRLPTSVCLKEAS